MLGVFRKKAPTVAAAATAAVCSAMIAGGHHPQGLSSSSSPFSLFRTQLSRCYASPLVDSDKIRPGHVTGVHMEKPDDSGMILTPPAAETIDKVLQTKTSFVTPIQYVAFSAARVCIGQCKG